MPSQMPAILQAVMKGQSKALQMPTILVGISLQSPD